MRKNLFLTFAMVLAFFAGANAQDQDWSMTLSGAEGLPGNNVTIEVEGVEKTYAAYQTLPIRLSEPTKKLRMTVYGVNNGAKQDGAHLLFTLSEVKVHTVDMQSVYNYTATSNADHNTLKQDANIPLDGQGIPALNDGDNTTYFHSLWDNGAQTTDGAEYHWLEFEFETEIQEFVLELNGRIDRTDQMPTTLVLTKGGVTVEPFANKKFEMKEQVTTLEALAAAPYIVMRGNASETYTQYNHSASTPDNKVVDEKDGQKLQGVEGTGPMYYSQQGTRSKEVSIEYVVQLIPVEGKENTYLVYYPEYDKYMSTHGFDFSTLQGWQQATDDEDQAAQVTFTEFGNGDFEMYYTLKDKETGAEHIVYIGADPRQNVHGMKVLEKNKKEFLVVNGYCVSYGIKSAFNWTISLADYETAPWTAVYKYRKLGDQMRNTMKKFEAIEGFEYDFTSVFEEIIAEIDEALVEATITAEEIAANTKQYKKDIHDTLAAILEEEQMMVDEVEALAELRLQTSLEFVNGAYDLNVYNACIQENIINRIASLAALSTESETALYNNINNVVAYFSQKAGNLSSFYASKYEVLDFSFIMTSNAEALGQVMEVTNPADESNKFSTYVWERQFKMKEAIDGFRMTFVDTNTKGNHHFYKGYPLISLAELEVYDDNGNKMELNDALVTTNSFCLRKDDEGNITEDGRVINLFDEDYATYYQSMWNDGGGTFDPVDSVYLDIKFPEGVEIADFKIKTIGRYQSDKGLAPKSVRFTAYGEKYNPAFERPNTYNVRDIKKVTDPADLKDGGLYIIQGNLNANNIYNTAVPYYYSGRDHFHTKQSIAMNDTCVYALEKDGEGWKIKSLSHGMYWTVDGGLTLDKNEAANILVAKSENEYSEIEDAMVLYSIVPDTTIVAGWEWKEDKNFPISIKEQEITVNKMVYMDWYNGLNTRLCASEQPGVFEYGYDEVMNHEYYDGILLGRNLDYTFEAGDHLHFNKTNGEGEWCIYEVKMDTPEFVYLKGVANNTAVGSTWVFGKNPGCKDVAEADIEAYNVAKAAAEVAIEEKAVENAETYAQNLANAFLKIANVEPVKISYKGHYAIVSAFEGFQTSNGKTRAWYFSENEESIRWTNTPDEWTNNYIFEFEKIGSVDHEAFESKKEYEGKAFWIRSVGATEFYEGTDAYLGGTGTNGGTTEADATEENPTGTGSSNMSVFAFEDAIAFIVEPASWTDSSRKFQKDDVFSIKQLGENSTYIHANAHKSGKGEEGGLIAWCGSDQYDSKCVWRLIHIEGTGSEDPEDLIIASVKDILGEEVVDVKIYTPAGVAIPALEKGINIVIKQYANGAVEATKVLVK